MKKTHEEIKQTRTFKEVSKWFAKIEFLKNQISALEKITNIPIISISIFLLKTQLIEFELKQLLLSLDQHISFSNTSEILKRKIMTPVEYDEKQYTLGKLVGKLKEFKGDFLNKLQNDLVKLTKSRNAFAHKLFHSDYGIEDLNPSSQKGIRLVNRVLSEINNAEKYLKIHDPFKSFK